ncbi:MAG: type 4a pilus biogenesis protein PilO [Sinobacterium sp.]|nr:type 4a pilus biogenesis protein PilO [Sinobacterium sp.]
MSFQDKIQDVQDQFQSIDWNNIRPDNVGSWPFIVKVMAWLSLLIVIVALGYYGVIADLQKQEASVVAEEVRLKKDFKKKAVDAANLAAYRVQMEEMSASFEAMISQLPSETEVPGLLEDITAKGVSSGLDFDSITLQKEQKKEFYIQLPIAIKAAGTYHDMGAFVGGVASLPRIVTLSDFTIKVTGGQRENSKLNFDVLAHTYRYNDTSKSKKKRK